MTTDNLTNNKRLFNWDNRDFKIQRRGRQRECKKKGFISKTQLCTCITLFCTFLLPFLHDYDVKMPNFAFYGQRKLAKTKFNFSF